MSVRAHAGTPGLPAAVSVDRLPVVEVGPGCTRRDLPALPGARAWVVDMAPGSTWPHVDDHPDGEAYYVVSGEVIEGARRFGPGTCVRFAPGSRHQPRSEVGVRLFGLNPVPVRAGGEAAADARDPGGVESP